MNAVTFPKSSNGSPVDTLLSVDESRAVSASVTLVLEWLSRASQLGGKAPIKVALLLASYATKLGQTKNLRLFRQTTEAAALPRVSAYEGLVALESAGFIVVERQRGCPPLVHLKGWDDIEKTIEDGCLED